jgi:hypothetical protein
MSHVEAVEHGASGETIAARLTKRVAEMSPSRTARVAGGLYLAVVITGMFALLARPALIVPGDAAATAANIVASEGLFRLTWTADLVATVCYVGVTVFLYALLAPVSRVVSLLAAFLGFAGCVIGAALSLNGLLPLLLLGGAPGLSAFSPDELIALLQLFKGSQGAGANVNFVFFGCYCVTLGYLVYRSTFIPRILGVGLVVSGLAWLVNSFAAFLSPALASLLAPYPLAIGAFGEIAFTLWILVRGVNGQRWNEQAAGGRGATDRVRFAPTPLPP